MKTYPSLLLGSFLIIACSPEPKPKAKTYAFRYLGEYYPSFMPSCTISIVAYGSTNRIKWHAYDDRRATPVTLFADSAHLSAADLSFFFAKLDSVPVLTLGSRHYPSGTDGITVDNTVTQGNASNKFTFWSPRKHRSPQEHRLVEAVLGLSRRKFTAPNEQAYFESLEQYFDFGLPCKVTRAVPLEVRMYGTLSANKEQALVAFVRQLPSTAPILVDMTNFEGMGTMFYPLFKSLLARNDRIVWVASKWSQKQLLEIGVATDKITYSTANGRSLIEKLSRVTATVDNSIP